MNGVSVTGGRIEYVWVGAEGAAGAAVRPLVFVHEGLGCAAMWGRFPQALANATGARALVYSRFGYGGSDPVPSPRTSRFMHDEAIVVLPELLQRLGVAAPILIGQSDGASIALIHAAARPGELAGLILEAPHVFAEQQTIDGVASIGARYAADAEFRRAFDRHHRDGAMVVREWSDAWLAPSFRTWSIEESLASITCPVLLLQAEHDPYGSLTHVERIAAAVRGPVRTVILPGDGHAPHRDCRMRVLGEMTDFVAALHAVT